MASEEHRKRYRDFNQVIYKVETGFLTKRCTRCGTPWDDREECKCGIVRYKNCGTCAWSFEISRKSKKNPFGKGTPRFKISRRYCFYNDKWAEPSTRGIKQWNRRDLVSVKRTNTCNLWVSKNWKAELKKIKGVRSIPTNVKRSVWIRDKGKCVTCGSNQNLEFDHIIPHSRGGSNTERNIQLLCSACNRKKLDRIV